MASADISTKAQHALITGGGSGIGLAIALHLKSAGLAVTIVGRNRDRLEAVATAQDLHFSECDVTDEAMVRSQFAKAEQVAGPIDILINNAGGVKTAPFEKQSLDDWNSALDLNLLGPVRCISAVLPGMKERGWGRIVNIGSTAGLKGYAYVSAYTAAKHAVVGMTRALSLELAKTGVTVNAICPGYSDTDIIRSAVSNIMEKTGRSEAEALKTFTGTNPQGRLIAPADVAAAVGWLISDAAGSVTGTALPIAGGEI